MNNIDLDKNVFNNNPSALCPYIDMLLKNKEVFERNNTDDKLRIMFRGHSDANYSLCPSVFRDNNLPKEEQMVSELKRTEPQEFETCSSQFEYLVKMQHYNLPTRLLDVTFNPLVALYFACCDTNKLDKYGMVYTFIDYAHSPDEPCIQRNAMLSAYSGSTPKELAEFFHLDSDLIKPDRTPDKEFLKSFFGENYYAVVPPLNNERIRRQHGAFLLFGLNLDGQSNPFQKEAFCINPPCKIGNSIINGVGILPSWKKQILKELDCMGINQASLFPELEHQAAYIKRKYCGS